MRAVWGADAAGEKKLSGGKYHYLYDNDVSTTQWQELEPQSPFYLFTPHDIELLREYETGWKVTEIMPVHSVGIVTARDALTIHWSPKDVWRTINDFVNLPTEEARERYNLGKDVQDWKVHLAQQDVLNSGPQEQMLAKLLYRPFDERSTYYTGNTKGFICRPRPKIMRHMIIGENIGLITTRQTRDKWDVFTTSTIMTHKAVSAYDINSLFPLYLYMKISDEPKDLSNAPEATEVIERMPNLAPDFIQILSDHLGMDFIQNGTGDVNVTFGPEDLFHYMYSVFHSPGYRSRYADFLKRDFPRLPLTSNIELFRALCGLGERLKALHLMEEPADPITTYPERGDNSVDKVRYDDRNERVYINESQFFEGVPRRVWQFHVGGYQVCRKWLKDRKGRRLSYDDLTHYQRVVSALRDTIDIMAEIDEAIEEHGGWPLQ